MDTTGEICYYTDRLTQYLRESFPDLVDDKEFIKAQADSAAEAYYDAFLQGYHADVCNDFATKALYEGLIFSKYDILAEILFHEFSSQVDEEKIRPFARQLMPVCEPVFAEYPIGDEFAASPDFTKLYTELMGTIVMWLEENGLPE